MKYIFGLLIGLLLWVGSVSSVYADATLSIQPQNAQFNAGETLEARVVLNAPNTYDVFSFDIVLRYDPTKLEVLSIREEANVFDKPIVAPPVRTRGEIRYSKSNFSSTEINGEVPLATITFKVNGGSLITFSKKEIVDSKNNRIVPTSATNGRYTIIGSTGEIITDGGPVVTQRPTEAPKQEVKVTPNCKTANNVDGISTELGCIPTEIGGFVASFYSIGLGFIGGVAVLVIIYGGYLIMTSNGDQRKLANGRSYIVYALSGLLLAIFGYVFMQVIIVDVLKIPGFS